MSFYLISHIQKVSTHCKEENKKTHENWSKNNKSYSKLKNALKIPNF